MKAIVRGKVIAESADVVDNDGYHYFPAASVQMQSLEKTPKTHKDHACPHVVQFYDVVIDGVRHPRNAWVYEAPRPNKSELAGRFGFWQDVEVS
jgi:uncharacterized protein (DUF427 family)